MANLVTSTYTPGSCIYNSFPSIPYSSLPLSPCPIIGITCTYQYLKPWISWIFYSDLAMTWRQGTWRNQKILGGWVNTNVRYLIVVWLHIHLSSGFFKVLNLSPYSNILLTESGFQQTSIRDNKLELGSQTLAGNISVQI